MISRLPSRLGDQIANANGVSLLSVTHAEAVKILKDTGFSIDLVSYYVNIHIFYMLHVLLTRLSDAKMTGSGHQHLIMVLWIEDTDVCTLAYPLLMMIIIIKCVFSTQ